jgi:hypothetical protein
LQRRFDATDKWIETQARVESVLDDGRKINQVVARGSYGAEAARLWAALRTGINDLARAYGVQPLAINVVTEREALEHGPQLLTREQCRHRAPLARARIFTRSNQC